MLKFLRILKMLILFVMIYHLVSAEDFELNESAARATGSEKVLSRKKRYLVFPEGSSLQLVFCLTYPTIANGNIFVMGATAALAWELPHDPFGPFKKKAELLHRKDVVKPSHGAWNKNKGISMTNLKRIPYKGSNMKRPSSYSTLNSLLSKFTNKFPFTPAVNKNVINYKNPTFVIKKPVTTYLDPYYQQVHRRTRRELFSKVEKLFTSQNKDGKACLLKAICEVTQAPNRVGSFMEEIIKTIFRPKPNEEYPDEDGYDQAANKTHDCKKQYPTCDFSILNSV